MSPLISILIPVFNSEEYLHRCIDSILSQTYPNYEIVLVNDGSEDKSAEICNEYSEKHANIIFIDTPHLGVSNARNLSIKHAKGDYYVFVDSDDFISKYTLTALYETLVSTDSDIVQCNMQRTQDSTIHEIPIEAALHGGNNIQIFQDGNPIWDFQSSKTPFRCMLAGKIFKKGLFEGIEFPIGKIHEDEWAMHHIMYKCRRISHLDVALYYYYKNPNSIMQQRFNLARYDALYAIQDRIDFLLEKKYDLYSNINRLRYCLEAVNLYRLTVEHYPEEKKRLAFLQQAYKEQYHKIIDLDFISQELRKSLTMWIIDPLKGEYVNYWGYIGDLE